MMFLNILILITSYLLLFNDIHWNRIREIAGICPWLGGEAVYIAQGIIMSNSDINEWEDMDICNTSITPSGAKLANINATEVFNQKIEEAKTKIEANKVIIYPNPTHDFLYVNTNGEKIVKYIIKDLSGRIIVNNIYTTNKINIDFLKSGAYIFELLNASNYSIKLKFMKDE